VISRRAWAALLVPLALGACKGKGSTHDAPAKGSGSGTTTPVVVRADAATAAKPVRAEHAVWKLVDNRHTAHRGIDGELVLDAGDFGFARYTRFGMPALRWHLGQVVDGERAAIAERLASLDVPLTAEQAAATQITARVHADAKQTIAVKVNGRKGARVDLEPGWQTVALTLDLTRDAGRFAAGENQLVFETTGGKPKVEPKVEPKAENKVENKVAIAWLRIGRIHPPADQDPRSAAAFDAKADAIELAQNAELAWYLTVPDGAHLVAEVAPPCHVEVRGRASDDSVVGGLLGGEDKRVDLSTAAGKVVRLSLVARDCPRAKLVHPAITLHGPDPTPLPKAEPPRFVILWVMDALRADKVSIFTPGARAQTPELDELAKSSTVFRQYYVQGNESQTSHSSFWTSLYPAVHGVRLAGDAAGINSLLAKRFPTISTELTTAGLYTMAVTGNGYVNDEDGYTRGFKEFRNMMRESGVENNFIPGNKIVDVALEVFDKHRDQPTYMFLGTIDTHGPWVARKPWIDIYSPPPYRGPFQEFGTAKDLGIRAGSMGCAIIPPKEDIERLRAIYDSAVSFHDQQVGRVIAQLKGWGIWDQTLLIITADHGEELFEDQRCGHGGSLRDSLERVPLLIHDPARFPGGTIVDEGVEGVDLLPTMLSALGRPPLDSAQGSELESLAQGVGRGWPRPSYASQYEYAHAMRIGRWKARVGRTGVPIIGDMVDDPDETKDHVLDRPVERRMLTDNLGLFLALRKDWKKASWGVVTNMTAAGAAALDEASTP
jgi:arylsulfatase A-like enzyme